MGQVSKRLVIWSTSRMLRWEKVKEYKKERIPLQSEHQKKRERNHFVTKNLHICISLRDIYINVPSSDLTEECFSFQLVRLSHSNTKLTYCDSYFWLVERSVLNPLFNKAIVVGLLGHCPNLFGCGSIWAPTVNVYENDMCYLIYLKILICIYFIFKTIFILIL